MRERQDWGAIVVVSTLDGASGDVPGWQTLSQHAQETLQQIFRGWSIEPLRHVQEARNKPIALSNVGACRGSDFF
jgi:hypothetical protein